VDPATAGWAWNSVDGELYAAGLDERAPSATAETQLRPSERRVAARRQLWVARNALTLYGLDHPPEAAAFDLAKDQWELIISAGLLPAAPANPFSPGALATRVIGVSEPGVTGDGVDAGQAGWVWNTADRQLYLAGEPE
jgi:hypothetical protein